MAELSPCSSIRSTTTGNSEYSDEEMDPDTKQELQNLIVKLDNSLPSDKLYELLLKIRYYSNAEGTNVPGLSSMLNGKQGEELTIKLLNLLERPNSKVVDVSLSVLGNLAMYDLPRAAMTTNNGVNVLVKIISSLAEEKILGRACRVIANLAMNDQASSEFHNKGTVHLLEKTITDVNDAKAKGAAIRAIRILCEQKGKHRKIITESNGISLIMSTLIETDDLDLMKIIVKCLAVLTEDTHTNNGACGTKDANIKIVQQIEEQSDQFKKIIELVHNESITLSGRHKKIPRQIWIPSMTILVNLSNHSKLRPKLGNSGFIPAFVSRLQKYDTTLSHKQFHHCVYALCLYCEESVNRVKLRELGGLQFFVSLLSSNKPHHVGAHKKVLGSLIRFGYDSISMKYLDYAGLVPCVVALLNDYVSSNRNNHECRKENKLSSNDESTVLDNCNTISEQQQKKRTNRSSVFLDVGQILESNNSSQNCEISNEMNEQQISTAIPKTPSSIQNSDKADTSSDSLFEIDESDYNKKIDWILQILLRLYENPPLSDYLTDINTTKAVVQYLCWTKCDSVTHRRAGLVLSCLSKRIESIMPFLLQGFFPWLRLELDIRLQTSDLLSCIQCQTLNSLFTTVYQTFIFTAESGYIEGTVCHTLVAPGAADETSRSVITVGIISLITCKTILFNILITHGGLEVLLQTLETQAISENDTDLFSHAVLSLNLLAQRVDVVSSIDDRPLTLEQYQQTDGVNEIPENSAQSMNVTNQHVCCYKQCKQVKNLALKFEDGSTIMVNKEVIVAASNVFEAMLLGRFSEAGQNEVFLPKTSASAMLRIVHYLYGCRRWAGKDGCCRYSPGLVGTSVNFTMPSNIVSQYEDDLKMLLDLVPMSDKYLLTDLNVFVSRMIVMQCTQNPEGKMKIAYRRSLNIFCPSTNNIKKRTGQDMTEIIVNHDDNSPYSSAALNVQLVAFLLAGNIQHKTRVKLFRELANLDSGISADFVDDINQIITSSLKTAMKKPKPIIVKQYSPRTHTQ